MVVITVKLYQDASKDTMPDENEKFFWVKMEDAKNGLGIKNMPQMVRQEIIGIFGTKNLTKEQRKQYIRSTNEINKSLKNGFPCYKYARSNITEKIIKNCRGIKRCNDGLDRKDRKTKRKFWNTFRI